MDVNCESGGLVVETNDCGVYPWYGLAGHSVHACWGECYYQAVFYVSSPDGHVREIYNNNGWHTADLTADTNGPTTGGTAQITGFFDGCSEHVFYISSSDLHVRELYSMAPGTVMT